MRTKTKPNRKHKSIQIGRVADDYADDYFLDKCTTCNKQIERAGDEWIHTDSEYEARAKHVANPAKRYKQKAKKRNGKRAGETGRKDD